MIIILFALGLILLLLIINSLRQPESSILSKKNSFISEWIKPAVTNLDLYNHIDNFLPAKIHKVLDGDTAIAFIKNYKFTIRLAAIDCPEGSQEWGDIATYGLIKLIGGKAIRLEVYGFDDYGRILATVFVLDKGKWLNVNERMVMLGHAWVLRNYYQHLPQDRQNSLDNFEKWAKNKKVGLWRTTNPIPPWQHRSSLKA